MADSPVSQDDLRDLIDRIDPYDMEAVKESLRLLSDEQAAEIIPMLPRFTQVRLFEAMRPAQSSGIVAEMMSNEAADVLGKVSSEKLREIMGEMAQEDADAIQDLLRYPEDSAGGIMRKEFVTAREDMTVGQAIEAVKFRREEESRSVFYIYVTDVEGKMKGILRIHDLIFRPPETRVADIMNPEVRVVSVHADREQIAALFQKHHYLALPVVDDFGRLRGIVTSDDVIQVMEQEATEDIQHMGGLSGEERIDTPWPQVTRNRLIWLFVNLLTAFFAAWIVSLFADTISKYAVLAIFLPIVSGQGGNAGTQTLTIVVRALALGQIRMDAKFRVLAKELFVSLLTGGATGVAVGLVCWWWQGNLALGAIVCASMMLNMLAAAGAGVAVPFLLRALKIDPALASSILVTTVTDVVGFFVFLAMATAALVYYPGIFQ
ncbi:MAG: magnesium transporter [Candidatus Methylacidiphilales bacterium]|nr:magnesium transporter [Candidatus Methylacidiphilales bacterium]